MACRRMFFRSRRGAQYAKRLGRRLLSLPRSYDRVQGDGSPSSMMVLVDTGQVDGMACHLSSFDKYTVQDFFSPRTPECYVSAVPGECQVYPVTLHEHRI